jgi:hypothetical protein
MLFAPQLLIPARPKLAAAASGFSLKSHTAAAAANSPVTSAIDTSGANLIVVVVSQFSGAAIGTLSDSKSNTWTPLTAQTSTNAYTQTFYAASPTVGAGHTFTFTGSGIFGAIAVQAWSNANAVPFNVQNGAVVTSTSLATGSVTPGQNNSLLVAALSSADTGVYAIDSGFTISDQIADVGGVNLGIGMASLVQGSAAAVNATWSWATTANAAVAISAFKP